MCALAVLAASPQDTRAFSIDIVLGNVSDSPAYDADRSGMLALFNYAANFYEDIFAGNNFDVTLAVSYAELGGSTLGLYTPVLNTIQIDTSRTWFLDEITPEDNSEYSMSQTLWRDLSSGERSDFYNFSGSVPNTFEVGYRGAAFSNMGGANAFDMLSVVMHEVGHALGIGTFETPLETAIDLDYDFTPDWVGGATLASEQGNLSGDDGLNFGHIEAPDAMMSPSIGMNTRKLPSHTDLFSMASSLNFTALDVPRREFYGGGDWFDNAVWSGDTPPGSADEAFIRDTLDANLDGNAVAGSVHVSEGANLRTFNFKLDVTGDIDVSDVDSDIFIAPGGELEARGLSILNQSEVEMSGGLIDVDNLTIAEGTQLEATAGTPAVDVATSLNNNGRIIARNNSTLTFTSTGTAPWDLDGSDGNGIIDARDGDITFGSGGVTNSFNGDILIDNSHTLTIAADWTVAPSGSIEFAGSGEIAGGKIELRGDLDVLDGTVTINAPVDVLSSASLSVAAGDFLLLNGALFHSGFLELGAGAIMNVNDDALVSIGATSDIDGFLNFNRPTTVSGGSLTGDGRVRFNNTATILGSANIDMGAFEVGPGAGSVAVRDVTVSADTVNVLGDLVVRRGAVVQSSGAATINAISGVAEVRVFEPDSQFNAASLRLGIGASDEGRLDVQSSGGANISGDLEVGVAGQGDVFIANGGVVNVGGTTTIGDQDTLVVMDGVFNSTNLNIAAGGIAALNAGEMNVDSINRPVGATFNHFGGILRITGGDSDFRGSVAHGSPNNPFVRIQGGADVSVQFAWRLGLDAGDFANLIVVGTDGGTRRSQLRGTGGGAGADLIVGRDGDAVVLVNSGGLIALRDDLVVGEGAGGRGQLTIAGVSNGFRSTVDVTGSGSTSVVDLGVAGTSLVTVQSGGLLQTSSDMWLARSGGSTSFLTIGGSLGGFDSEVIVADDIFVGGSGGAVGGQATINLNAGGRLTADQMLVWGGSAVNVDGGEMILNSLNNQASSLLTLDGGQVVTNNVTLASANTLDLNGGTFEVRGGDGDFSSATFSFGGSAANAPTLRVTSGADLATGALLIGNATGEHGAVHVTGTNADGSRRSSLGTLGGGGGPTSASDRTEPVSSRSRMAVWFPSRTMLRSPASRSTQWASSRSAALPTLPAA